MRLWHKDLIGVLPRQQLVGQWRECCAIARNIAINGTPNHILVNKIMDYPMEHFWAYARLVCYEMIFRGYECHWASFGQWLDRMGSFPEKIEITQDDIFYDWHNDKYYWQCCANLEEKYDCGAITDEEWEIICDETCLRL